jgi:hypothetical protein
LPTFFQIDRRAIAAEAQALEREHGYPGAVQVLRERIVQADRPGRRRLYRLHDEIARRHGWAEA